MWPNAGYVNLYLGSLGIRITISMIVDATILHAPSSTKNEEKKRDAEMHETQKRNLWFFGTKVRLGVDSKEEIVHSVRSIAASVSDVHTLPELLRGDEKRIEGDAVYQAQAEVTRAAMPGADDMTSRRANTKAGVDALRKRKNRTKARVRTKVEWSFHELKRIFGFT